MPLIRLSHITRRDLQVNRAVIFIFGDNLAGVGYGGQAKEMRGEPNAVGIATKVSPHQVFTTQDYQRAVDAAEPILDRIDRALFEGRTVVMPLDGIGTGRAQLAICCPQFLTFLTSRFQAWSAY